MNPYVLPTSVEINGKEYRIRTDFRAVLDVLAAQKDPDLDDRARAMVMLKIMYPDYQTILVNELNEAIEKAIEFIDCGYVDDGKPKPQLVDWQQDANMIISAINKVAHAEVRQMQNLHWWTFFSYYMEIGESLFSQVLNIRAKKAKGKKLEKYEREFYRENKQIIDLHVNESEETKAEIRREKDSILEYFNKKEGGGKK